MELKKIEKLLKRRRRPYEYANLRLAIRLFCLECSGYNSNEVGRCPASECWLYPFRTSEGKKKNLKFDDEFRKLWEKRHDN